jgi:predicted CoA-binding protein
VSPFEPFSDFENPGDEEVRRLLEQARRIAVVGLSPKPHRDSNRVGRYLLEHGYTVIPVYPREALILEQPVYRRIVDIPGGVDLVDVFRRSSEIPGVIDDALRARAPAIWLQLDCIDDAGARRAKEAGVTMVMDRCLMVDHARLLGRNWRRASSAPTELGLKATKT